MHARILSRQIAPPMLPSTVLHRTNLVATLREVILNDVPHAPSRPVKKLVLLCAPAGYGKTTLLADFAASASLPCCWYFLEHTDTDLVVFLRTLLTSLCVAFPQLDKTLAAAFTNLFARDTADPSAAHRFAIDMLCDAICAEVPERFALFLCNYEQINESETLTDLLNYLLSKLPTQMVLVIESRALPQLEIAQLIVRDEMFALNSYTLRFSAEEIADLARIHGLTALTMDDAEHLASSFDGWIAGILLGTRLGDLRLLPSNQVRDARSEMSFLWENAAPARQRRNLFAYVAHEIFQHDQLLYRFLLPSSILQVMEPELCNALLNTTEATEWLAHAEQRGLFVSSYEDASQLIYTCHPVIRDLLTTHLRQREPERFLALHCKAAELWHARLNYDQAMYHAIEAQAYDLAVQCITESYKQLMQQGRLETLTHWLQALPSDTREHSPRLLLIEGAVALARGQHLQAFPVVEKVANLLAELAGQYMSAEIEHFQFEVTVLRSRALYQAGDYAQARDLCLQTLQALPDHEIELHTEARLRLGICAIFLGDYPTGILILQEVLHNWHYQLPPYQIADIHGVLVNAYYLTGNFALAEHHLTRALSYCEQIRDEQGKVNNLTRRGVIAGEQGRYQEAENDLQEALALTHHSLAAHSREASVLANLGFLRLEQGMYAQALTFYEDALALASSSKNQHIVHSILINMSLAHLFLGDTTSALLLLDKIEAPTSDELGLNYEQAERELTYSLILLYQQCYVDATARLTAIVMALQKSGLQLELQIARLRLSACQLATRQEQAALDMLSEVTLWLVDHAHYAHQILVQICWLPELLKLAKCSPQLKRLRTLLSLDTDEPISSVMLLPPSLPKLTIRAFGEPVVLLNEQPIKRWRMARAMELFFFLLDANVPESKERIITALWPEFDENVNQTFHSTLHQLRKLFGESCPVFTANGYSLNLAVSYEENVWYDVQEFRLQRSTADQALAREDDAAAKEALLRMVDLYRGDYGRPFSNDWCTLRRDELCTIYLETQRHLAQIAWRSQTYDESIAHWQHILEKDNCREEAHYHVMLCYLRMNRRTAALRHYHVCKDILQGELGIEPGSAIENLYRRLRTKTAPSFDE